MITFLVILLVLGLVIVSFYRAKDKKLLKRKTVESLGDDLWNEINEERDRSVEAGKKFRKILEEIKKTPHN